MTTTSETDPIRREIALAQEAIDRYHELTAIEAQLQTERLASIENRLGDIEQTMADLHRTVDGLLKSRIWRTLAYAAKLIQPDTGAGR